MTIWHPLDGNMIAADAHYGSHASPAPACSYCGEDGEDMDLRIIPRPYGDDDITCRACFEGSDGENSFTDLEAA